MKPVYDAYVRHGDGDKVMECIAETYGRGKPCWNVDRQCSLRLLRKCERLVRCAGFHQKAHDTANEILFSGPLAGAANRRRPAPAGVGTASIAAAMMMILMRSLWIEGEKRVLAYVDSNLSAKLLGPFQFNCRYEIPRARLSLPARKRASALMRRAGHPRRTARGSD
jgi:hypothetical protein